MASNDLRPLKGIAKKVVSLYKNIQKIQQVIYFSDKHVYHTCVHTGFITCKEIIIFFLKLKKLL